MSAPGSAVVDGLDARLIWLLLPQRSCSSISDGRCLYCLLEVSGPKTDMWALHLVHPIEAVEVQLQ